MKNWIFVTPALILQLQGAKLHEELKPLANPTLASARIVLEALKSNTDPLSIEAVTAKALKGVFTEEHQLHEKINSAKKIAREADQLDARAREWLKPNALGSVEKTHSENLANQARTLRVSALSELAQAIEELSIAQDSMVEVVGHLTAKGDTESAKILFDVAAAIENRTTGPADGFYQQMVADSSQKDQTIFREVSSTDENARSARQLTDAGDRAARRAYRNALRNGDAAAAFKVLRATDLIQSSEQYLGNKNQKEVHDLAFEQPQCQISMIKEEYRVVFSSAAAARSQGYDYCGHCIGGSKR